MAGDYTANFLNLVPEQLRRVRQKKKPSAAETAQVVLRNTEYMTELYDGHFFPHANVDMLRLRYMTRSLLQRASTSSREDGSRIKAVERMGKTLAKNYDKNQDDMCFDEYCARAVIHICEYIVCKTEALLYESTDIEECARRACLSRGFKDVCALELGILTLVDWRIFHDMDTLIAMELEQENRGSQGGGGGEKEGDDRDSATRFLQAASETDIWRINSCFTRVQTDHTEVKMQLLKRDEILETEEDDDETDVY